MCLKSLIALLAVALLLPGPAAARKIHLSPQGDDQQTGDSAATPIRTLERAEQLARSTLEREPEDIELVFAPGTYRDPGVVWKAISPDHRVSLTGDVSDPAAVTFDGGGEGTFLRLRSALGKPSNLTISGLTITRYETAISLDGDRTKPDSYNGNNRIIGNRFVHIGAQREGQKRSTAAVRLVMSRNNVISGNEFRDIRNVRGCTALHAIYLANRASGNIIEKNTFDGGCGVPLKVRDASNDNKFIDNTFRNQTAAALFVDSYCDEDRGVDCSRLECPSWNNRLQSNVYDPVSAAPKWVRILRMPAAAQCHIGTTRVIENGVARDQ